jgi:hypothetical protein
LPPLHSALQNYIIIITIILLQLGVHPVAVDFTLSSRPYTYRDKEIRLYIKATIQNKVPAINKVHTMKNPNIYGN